MRLGLYCAILSGLLASLIFIVPLPYGPQRVVGGAFPNVGTLPRCLRIDYAPNDMPSDLPKRVRLMSVRGFKPGTFGAYKSTSGHLVEWANWRPAGPDSLDILWHHSPIVRISIHGDTLRGRMAYGGSLPLMFRSSDERDVPVAAYPMSCVEFDTSRR